MQTSVARVDVEIRVGDPVRSYDFPEYFDLSGVGGQNVRGCYVDGTVEDIIVVDHVPPYSIKVDASVYQGRPWIYDPPLTHVLIPVNGTPRGGYRKGVNRHVIRR